MGGDQDSESFQEYLKFISTYGKTDQTREGFEKRYEIFKQNYKRIIEHNKLYEAGGPGAPEFDMIVNRFADLTEEEFLEQNTGLKVPKHKTEKMKNFKFPVPEKNESKRRRLNGGTMRVYYDTDPRLEGEKNATDSDEQKVVSVPVYKNWFEEGKVTIPYDQAGCGGCWAFSAAAATESLAFITGHLKELTEFSV